MKKVLIASLMVAMGVLLGGCQSNPLQTGGQSNVSVVDSGTRAHLQAELTMADYTDLAEKVTNKMLSSRFVGSWGKRKPRLILAKLRNNTDTESIRMADIYDRITETLLNSGTVRLVDTSATSFDYVVRSELSSNRQYGSGNQQLVGYKLELKLFTIDGEMKGQWSGTLTLAKGKKSFL
jgi:PBP1b-binding outer membrane lipoprotein LpoB